MFTHVHRPHVFRAVFCVLFFLSALPTVVRSQEEATPTETVQANTASGPEIEALLNVYPTEGIPAGDAIIGDFVVGPGKVDLTLKPGESQTVEIMVTNRTGERRKFNLAVEDAAGSLDTETSIVLLGDDKGPYSLKDYISIPHTSFVLDQNQRARIPVTITLPPNAEPGGLYGSVLVNTLAIEAKEGNTGGTSPQSAIIARIGTLFFITIPGAVEKDGNLMDFTTVPEKTFYQSSPITFGLLYDNRGSIHLAPYGELRITNIFNEEIGFVEIEPWFVLPQSHRLREITWDRDFLFGRYTATVYINRSYDDIIDEKSYSFWILPWKPLAGAFGILFIIFFIARAFFKNFEFKRK